MIACLDVDYKHTSATVLNYSTEGMVGFVYSFLL
jgi:hypothetical protein